MSLLEESTIKKFKTIGLPEAIKKNLVQNKFTPVINNFPSNHEGSKVTAATILLTKKETTKGQPQYGLSPVFFVKNQNVSQIQFEVEETKKTLGLSDDERLSLKNENTIKDVMFSSKKDNLLNIKGDLSCNKEGKILLSNILSTTKLESLKETKHLLNSTFRNEGITLDSLQKKSILNLKNKILSENIELPSNSKKNEKGAKTKKELDKKLKLESKVNLDPVYQSTKILNDLAKILKGGREIYKENKRDKRIEKVIKEGSATDKMEFKSDVKATLIKRIDIEHIEKTEGKKEDKNHVPDKKTIPGMKTTTMDGEKKLLLDAYVIALNESRLKGEPIKDDLDPTMKSELIQHIKDNNTFNINPELNKETVQRIEFEVNKIMKDFKSGLKFPTKNLPKEIQEGLFKEMNEEKKVERKFSSTQSKSKSRGMN